MILKVILKKFMLLQIYLSQLTKPNCKKLLECLLGKFIPNLIIESPNSRKLFEKDNEFIFDTPQINAFNWLKQLVAHTQTLKFFDKNLPIKILCDASKLGLAVASRLLIAAEVNYSQIEKDTLSIVFACEKFHEYFHVIRFVVKNNHKTLISIFQKTLNKLPPRIQRLLLRLQRYNFQLNCVPGN